MEEKTKPDYASFGKSVMYQVYQGNLGMSGAKPLSIGAPTYDAVLDHMRKTVMGFSARYGAQLPVGKDYETWTAITEVLKSAYGARVCDYSSALGEINKIKKDLTTDDRLSATIGQNDFTAKRQCVGFDS
jgi:hypothetical protein